MQLPSPLSLPRLFSQELKSKELAEAIFDMIDQDEEPEPGGEEEESNISIKELQEVLGVSSRGNTQT